MQALRKSAPEFGLELVDVPAATARPGEALVEIEAAAICGSDIHIYDWSGGYEAMAAHMPLTLGHEMAGRIVSLPEGASGLEVGQPVTIAPSVPCGTCEYCTTDRIEFCATRRAMGINSDGGFARYISVPPSHCLPLPPGVDVELAALVEPLTVGYEAASKAGVKAGDDVLVLGPGFIGQGIAVFARRMGAKRVVVVGHDDALRLGVVRSLGFDLTVDVAEMDLRDAVAAMGIKEFDVVIEATGVPATVTQGLGLLRKEGVLVVAGIHPRPLQLDLTLLVRQRHQLRGTQRAPREVWHKVLAALAEDPEMFRSMISDRMPLGEGLAAFELARTRQASKIVLDPAV